MATFHELRAQRRELLNELEDLEEAVAQLTTLLDNSSELLSEELLQYRREQRAWLQRQQAGALVILTETERALLGLGMDDWDET